MDLIALFGAVPFRFDALASHLADYKSPRQKILDLEKQGKIIRLKRGLYVVSPTLLRESPVTELIANHIYGPSYLSMETALRFYGLIPDAVFHAISMTMKRSRAFKNPFGRFDYISCSADYYPIGISQIVRHNHAFLIASPEKALCDQIVYTPKLSLRSMKSLQIYLEEDLRLDMEEFFKMDSSVFERCIGVSKKKTEIANVLKLLRK